MDLADYIVTNWNNSYNLGEILSAALWLRGAHKDFRPCV
jgi:hypothetical protein